MSTLIRRTRLPVSHAHGWVTKGLRRLMMQPTSSSTWRWTGGGGRSRDKYKGQEGGEGERAEARERGREGGKAVGRLEV